MQLDRVTRLGYCVLLGAYRVNRRHRMNGAVHFIPFDPDCAFTISVGKASM